ncbi:MAG: hypothetical protein WA694_24380, partial [Pseudolabrys sp.]
RLDYSNGSSVCAIIARLKHFLFVSPSEIICGRSAHNSINSQSSRLTDSSQTHSDAGNETDNY